ncbi:Phospholipase A2-alpha [Apostasia shenzhenica]|uniref:phospholipase A2 n=1 Tax=Apostasia shenzhenica TaxID=1088818 RepID=A0A2I0B7F9_9ASPA|nr:Phospholipase A2-alpha [Apostasia shenzhenica]
MDATGKRGLRQPALAVFLLLAGVFLSAADGLNIGIQSTGAGDAASKQQACSRKCESEHCTVPPFLRYGKYCGILYSGCPGEKPCDGLDACCMAHDACVQAKHNDYLSQECSEKFLNCMARFKEEDGPTFEGNKCMVQEVVDVITLVMEAALLAGRVLHKP